MGHRERASGLEDEDLRKTRSASLSRLRLSRTSPIAGHEPENENRCALAWSRARSGTENKIEKALRPRLDGPPCKRAEIAA